MSRISHAAMALTLASALSVGAASAQSIPSFGGQSQGNALSNATGGAAGLLGGGLPSLSSSSVGNVTGLLSYCAQNNYLQGDSALSATSAVNQLTKKPGVTDSPTYAAGTQGQLQTGNDNMFSLSSLKSGLKTRVCNMVLDKAKSFL
ncbi:DUF2501 domain-containing protein [Kozakia baliensis]|nr:DUF2501 domain-containing protein [Kozakia baliensis]GEL64060.1 hypothetical protein KBA01_13460 [Kozakia baliensis]